MATKKPGATGAAPVPAADPTTPAEFLGDRPDGMAVDGWMHHVELPGVADVDDEVAGWLAEAYRRATPRSDHRRSRRSVRRAGGVSPWSA